MAKLCSIEGETGGFALPADANWTELYSKLGGCMSGCQSSFTVPLRAALLVSWGSIVIWSVVRWVTDLDNGIGYWFTKVDGWGFMLELLYFIQLFVTTILASRRSSSSDKSEGTPWFVQATWLLGTMATVWAPTISVFYWGLNVVDDEWEGGGPDIYDFATQAGNYVIVLVDFFTTRQPFYLLHIWAPILFGIVYALFNYIYFLAGGLNEDGESRFIQSELDWNDPIPTLILFGLAILVLAPVFHVMHWFFARLRSGCAGAGSQVHSEQPGLAE